MEREFTVPGLIIEGDRGLKKLKVNSSNYFKTCMAKMKPGKVRITIKRESAKRSLNQNNYFHGPVLDLISEITGTVNKEHLKEWLKNEFGVKEVVTVSGKEYKVTKSTRYYSKLEFTEFLMKIEEFFDIVLPDPQEAGYLPR